MEAAAGGSAPNGTDRSRTARLRGLLRVGGDDEDASSVEHVEELEREVALLREENARLKVAREHAAERLLNERVRAAFPAHAGDDALDGEDVWETLTECMLLRDTLVDACRELERGAADLRVRLETLLCDAETGVGMRPSNDLEGVA